MTPYYEEPGITIYCADCRDVLPGLPRVDLVLTDPPYGIAGAFMRNNCTVIGDYSAAQFNADVDGWHESVGRLMTQGYVAEFMGGGLDALDKVRGRHVAAGFTPWRRFLLVKTAPPPTVRATFVSGWEDCLISYKGKREWYGGGYAVDRWIGLTPNRANEDWGHPVEKPHDALVALVRALSPQGSCVLDPFMGSGTTLVAAKQLGRRAIGIEIERRYCDIAVERLRQSVLPLEAVAEPAAQPMELFAS